MSAWVNDFVVAAKLVGWEEDILSDVTLPSCYSNLAVVHEFDMVVEDVVVVVRDVVVEHVGMARVVDVALHVAPSHVDVVAAHPCNTAVAILLVARDVCVVAMTVESWTVAVVWWRVCEICGATIFAYQRKGLPSLPVTEP